MKHSSVLQILKGKKKKNKSLCWILLAFCIGAVFWDWYLDVLRCKETAAQDFIHSGKKVFDPVQGAESPLSPHCSYLNWWFWGIIDSCIQPARWGWPYCNLDLSPCPSRQGPVRGDCAVCACAESMVNPSPSVEVDPLERSEGYLKQL